MCLWCYKKETCLNGCVSCSLHAALVFSNPVCKNIPLLSSCTASLVHSVFWHPRGYYGNSFSATFTTFVWLFIRVATVHHIWKYKSWARQKSFNCLLLIWGSGVVLYIVTLPSGLKPPPYMFISQSFENFKVKIQIGSYFRLHSWFSWFASQCSFVVCT